MRPVREIAYPIRSAYCCCYNHAVDNIRFINQTGVGEVAAHLSRRLNALTAKGDVLWLVPGGSAAIIAAEASRQLTNPGNLCICLTDERFGPPGHKDSNWQLLKQGGFKFPPNSYEILQNIDLAATTTAFADFLERSLGQSDFIVALFGMGPDGHIAGILPTSPAVGLADYAAGFKAEDFERITITPAFIAQMDEAFVFAAGRPKHAQIKKLSQKLALAEQPAQILKAILRVEFYNDLKPAAK
jgi:6-phosphogluconolactonase/glucosamine-6-phosphate isomerase/deaminase